MRYMRCGWLAGTLVEMPASPASGLEVPAVSSAECHGGGWGRSSRVTGQRGRGFRGRKLGWWWGKGKGAGVGEGNGERADGKGGGEGDKSVRVFLFVFD